MSDGATTPIYLIPALRVSVSDSVRAVTTSCLDQLTLRLRYELVRLDDVARNRRGGDDEGRREIDLAGAAAARKVSVLRADRHLIRRLRSARPGVDASAARRVNQLRARALEDFDVAARARVLLDLLRAELKVEVHARRDASALLDRALLDRRVHVHVGHLAARARAAVSDVNPDRLLQLGNCDAVARVAGRCDHRSNLGEVNLEAGGVLRVFVASQKALADFFFRESAHTLQVAKRDFVRLDDACKSPGLDGHVRSEERRVG